MVAFVSVILPCYNSAGSIRSAVLSILDQSFTNFELIIVDDASSDNTLATVEAINHPKIKILRQSKNMGYPSAMNEGIRISRGTYIARMDADDVSSPTRLQEQLKALERNPEASFCGVARYRITPGGKMYIDIKKYESLYVQETWDNLIQGNRIFTDPSVMIAKEKVLAVGGYRTFQRSGMDVDLWLRVMEKFGPCVTITAPLFGKRLEPGSLIFNPNTSLINKVPRVLARQRIENGVDDVQAGKGVNITEYKRIRWIKEGETEDKAGLFIGALVTCLWLSDWKGAGIYYKQIRRTRNMSLVRTIFMVLKKILQRVRSNPFVRYKLPT